MSEVTEPKTALREVREALQDALDDLHQDESTVWIRDAKESVNRALSRLDAVLAQAETWTRDRPTLPGWYWWRKEGVVLVMEVRSYKGGVLLAQTHPVAIHIDSPLLDDVEWCGPLPEPMRSDDDG